MGVRLDVGEEFAGHRIEGLIGRGGMGVVYLAEHLRLGRKVAIKILSPELARDDAFRRRFIRESQLAASLEHPNIVPVYDAGEIDDVAYISMRYVAGPDLSTFIKSAGSLDGPATVSIAAQIASALDAAHARDLVHRDVKPANVLLEPPSADGSLRAFLTDFGVTKNRSAAETTETGHFIGTIDYTSPEQIRGGVVDGRTDQYALACVIFECLTGRVPYPHQQQVAVMYGHLQEPPPRASGSGAAVTEELDETIMRGMAKRPDRRFESCHELVRHTASALGVALETPTPDWTTATTAVRPRIPDRRDTQPLAGPDGGAPDGRGHRRRLARVVAAIAIALTLVAGTVVTLVALNGRDESQPPFPERINWVRVTDQRELGGAGYQVINRGAVGDSRLVVVGYAIEDGDQNAAVWTSIDGMNWARQYGGPFGGPGAQGASAVAYDNSGFVAIGTDVDSPTVGDAVVWNSDDGTDWAPVEQQDVALAGDGIQQFRKLISTPEGLVAVGWDTRRGTQDAAIWRSQDKDNWTAQILDEPGIQELWGVTEFEGGLVAVGSETIEGERMDAAVWQAAPGKLWARIPGDRFEVPGKQTMKAVAVVPNGLVAVGTDSRGETAAVWTSPDARRWSRIRSDAFAGPGVEITGVIPYRDGVIMVGTAGPDGEREAAVWTSPDGRHWSRSLSTALEGPGNQIIKAILVFGDRLIAIGEDSGSEEGDGAVWVGTPETDTETEGA
jgi:serine/threonine-protein kinase